MHTDNLLLALKQLPGSGSLDRHYSVKRIIEAEKDIITAKQKQEEAFKNLAHDLFDPKGHDGWTVKEIWNTGLRAYPAFILELKKIASEAGVDFADETKT